MKTIEEKAKAYDKAIEKIKYVMEHGVSPTLNKEDLQDIFPELKESEDEKISREITEFILTHRIDEPNDIEDTNSWLAWLEKQGENSPVLSNSLNIGKKSWTEEDEIGSDATIEILEYFINYAPEYRKPTIRRSIDWLKSLKKRIEE